MSMCNPSIAYRIDPECKKWLDPKTGAFMEDTPKEILLRAETLYREMEKEQKRQYEEALKKGICL